MTNGCLLQYFFLGRKPKFLYLTKIMSPLIASTLVFLRAISSVLLGGGCGEW